VCTPGGKEATLLALNKITGQVIWKAALPEADQAAYASIIVAEVGGLKQYIQFLQKGLVGVEAKTGRLLWRYDGTIDAAANIGTPLFHDGMVFSSSNRNKGAVVKIAVKGDKAQVEPVWANKEVANSIGCMVVVGEYLYGTDNTNLLCVEFGTGKVVWKDKAAGKGAICCADGRLYVRGENGTVVLVEPTPDGYKEKGRFTPPEKSAKPSWPHPVVSNGMLFLRDQNLLYCYDVKK
jgi:outer membrane protein assembly factor BamB